PPTRGAGIATANARGGRGAPTRRRGGGGGGGGRRGGGAGAPPPAAAAGRRAGISTAGAMVVIGAPLSRGFRQACARQPQVDVVEGRAPRADRGREPELADRGERVGGAAVVERDGERRADAERVVAGHAACAE